VRRLAELAALGQLTGAHSGRRRGVEQPDDPWPGREGCAGWQSHHPTLGTIIVEPGARAWRCARGLVAGGDALKLWALVERGDLELTPPPAVAEAARARAREVSQ
jgi:hypothetical protein